MSRTRIAFVCFLGLLGASPADAQTPNEVNFSDLSLAPQSYNNGANLPGQFTSGGATFNNSYSTTYGSWSGWSYSNVTNMTTPGYTNQYAAYSVPTGGAGGHSPNYAVGYAFNPGDATISLPTGTRPTSIEVTNTAYDALSMLYGDQFAKKFGGWSGTDPDYFLLTITGLNSKNQQTGTVNFYLANFQSPTISQHYIVSQWTSVDLSSLSATTTSLSFGLSSSDNGPYGMNTPAYFAMDDLVLAPAAPEPTTTLLLATGGLGLWRFVRQRRGRSLAKT